MSNQKTTIQKLIEWCKQNAFNIEDQSGVKYVVIDYEEMKLLFPELKENEREQIIDSHVNHPEKPSMLYCQVHSFLGLKPIGL